MSLGNVGEPVVKWLSQGWDAIRDYAHHALTRFEHEDESSDVPQVWGIVAADVVDHDNDIEVRIEVPGLEKDDLSIEVRGNMVTVSGERRMSASRQVGSTMVTERAFGRFSRSIPLAVGIDQDAAKAELENGVLVITLPKKEQADSRKIEVG